MAADSETETLFGNNGGFTASIATVRTLNPPVLAESTMVEKQLAEYQLIVKTIRGLVKTPGVKPEAVLMAIDALLMGLDPEYAKDGA